MMTRKKFVDKAIRAFEREIGIPTGCGWWGTYHDVTNGVYRVRFSRDAWVLSRDGKVISRHDAKAYAIGKAMRLPK